MSLATFPSSCPILYWVIAIAWSIYQGFSGHIYGLYIFDNSGGTKTSSEFVRQAAYGIPHALLYLIASLSGFVALRYLVSLSENISDWSQVSAGTAAIQIALATISITGISGALARILYFGKSFGSLLQNPTKS